MIRLFPGHSMSFESFAVIRRLIPGMHNGKHEFRTYKTIRVIVTFNACIQL